MNAMPNLRSVPHRANPSIPIEIDPFADPAPPSLYNQIVRSIGDHAADKLIADFGGRRLYIVIAGHQINRLDRGARDGAIVRR